MIRTATVIGVEAREVLVNVTIEARLPRTSIVGLPAAAVRETSERVRSAIISAGFDYPKQRVVVNLEPADLRKDGTGFDLPIALAILEASGQIESIPADTIVVGELGLDGRVRGVRGLVPIALLAAESGATVMHADGAGVLEACPWAQTAPVYTLHDATASPARFEPGGVSPVQDPTQGPCMSEVRGQPLAKRAMEVAAAGGHHILFVGSPGVGKTMLACRMAGLLPPPTDQERQQTAAVRSAAGMGWGDPNIRAFRAPHHSISTAGMLGGATLRPGEASLAHGGVLLLDELPEFSRQVLELLRGPMETGQIVLSRASGVVKLPADFLLVAAANPCPCGYLGHPTRPCRCPDHMVARYRERLAGPLLDQIGLTVALEPVVASDLSGPPGETSEEIRERVVAARAFGAGREIDLTPAAAALLLAAGESLDLSKRQGDQLVAVARTIANLDASPRIDVAHLAEAVAFRTGGPS